MAPSQKEKPLLSSKWRPHFQAHKRFWNEYKLSHWSWRGSKTRTTELARSSITLLKWTGIGPSRTNSSSNVTIGILKYVNNFSGHVPKERIISHLVLSDSFLDVPKTVYFLLRSFAIVNDKAHTVTSYVKSVIKVDHYCDVTIALVRDLT
jgi:hypothetical protein